LVPSPSLAAALLATLPLASQAAEALAARAARLHREAIMVDTHEDVPEALRERWADLASPGATDHVDLPRLRAGGVTAAFFSIYLSAAHERSGTATREALAVSDMVDRIVAAHPDRLVPATTAAEIRAAKRVGKTAILKGVEGGHLVENSLASLRALARLGARYLTLTHVEAKGWADSSGQYHGVNGDPARVAPHGGLTDFGVRVVRELNRLGVAVDVSHASDATLARALEVSRAPVFASHSSCRGSPRNSFAAATPTRRCAASSARTS
jgi:membrane dipeptidase